MNNYNFERRLVLAAGKITQKNSWMPIFFQQDVDVNTRVAIWKIEEEAGAMDKRQSSDGVEIPKLTLLWSCKEAVYKWFGSGEVDFKEHIVVESLTDVGIDLFRTSICFKKKEPIELSLSSTYFTLTPSASNIDGADEQRLVLSYVVT
jgi:hypothetical protein